MKILFLCMKQFGYSTDITKWCKYLRNDHRITYLGWDYQLQDIYMDNINVISVSRKGAKLCRYIKYLIKAAQLLYRHKFDVCIINAFMGCSIIRTLFHKQTFALNIRSGSVCRNPIRRIFRNVRLRLEAMAFSNIIIISESLAEMLNIKRIKYEIIPVGAEPLKNIKTFDKRIKLLYIGTLSNRRIEDTIVGLGMYLGNHHDRDRINYTIVGDGTAGQLERMIHITEKLRLESHISFTGRLLHCDIIPYLSECNVGISYIPMTKYFDVQPPTKTFEYLLAGMPVIATRTTENMRIINRNNGILINDNAEDFCLGLEEFYKRRHDFSSAHIIADAKDYTWENIAEELEKYLRRVVDV